MLGANSAQSLEIFQDLWNRVSAQHLKDLGEGIKVLAEAISIGADIIEGMKVAAIGEFALSAAQTAAVAAESIATLELGAGAEAVVVETTHEVVKGIIDQAINQIGMELKQAMTAPILDTFDAFLSAAGDLGEQLLGDAVGATQGVDFSALEAAAEGGAEQGVSTLEGRVEHTAEDPGNQVSALLNGQGLQTDQQATDGHGFTWCSGSRRRRPPTKSITSPSGRNRIAKQHSAHRGGRRRRPHRLSKGMRPNHDKPCRSGDNGLLKPLSAVPRTRWGPDR